MPKFLANTGLAEIIAEHKGQRRQIFLLSYNDLVKKYKGAVLGYAWAIVKPLFTLLILLFAFQIGLRASSNVNGFPRFIFMLTGYVPWFFISEGILAGARSIRSNQQFVTKLSFPVSNIMSFTMLSNLYIHLVLSGLMFVYLAVMGYALTLYSLQFFYFVILMFVFFLAVSWATAPLSAFSKDFENLVNTIITSIFWLSGIFWNTYALKTRWLEIVMYFNPINYFVNGYRKAFIYHDFIFAREYALENLIFFGELILVIVVGSHYYKKLRKILPDVL
ncbi:MAG: ABC transporter permease [Oscillospiraceae bacterium]